MPMRAHNYGEVIPRDLPRDGTWLIEIDEAGAARSFTFGDFHDRADAIARGLLARGLTRGQAVGLLAGNSADYLMAFFGIVRAGLVAVPINFKLPKATIEHVVADAAVRFVFTDAERAALAGSLPAVRLDSAAEMAALAQPGAFAAPEMKDEEVALVLYTSGSTGRPKGVPLTHGGYVWAAQVLAASGPPMAGKRMLVAAPLYHMNGLLQSTLMNMAGGAVVLMKRFAADRYLETAAAHRCNVVTSIPTMLALASRETATLARIDLSPVDLVIMGSAPASEA
ncbi:MAG: AMP-binding protein, partial [Rhodospirillaceae bacterium]|nr:AMP-binding protein [Rhodospirillaceae bacterium]